jgi:cell division septation protein DedD
MKSNETGEFELVLGNKQLLSGFFVVALLFGVAFAMGYIVGRNSMPTQKAQTEAAVSTAGQSVRSQPAPAPEPPAAASAEPQPDTAAAQPAPDTLPEPTTQPAKDGPAAVTSEKPAAPPAAAAAAFDLESGTYWQVSALPQSEAEIFAKTLQDKGFPVSLSPAGRLNLTRVLVGPYPDTQALGRAKSQLEEAGFHPILLKKSE